MHLLILIVDDDQDDIEILRDGVREVETNAQCIYAHNGEDALHLLHSIVHGMPDVIFLDLNMPRMDGKKFLEAIKKDEKLSHIPVVIYTTSKLEKDKEETKALGAAHFISKPTTISELNKALAKAFAVCFKNEIKR
ncbi:response regulator [Ohtaekwangia koreensis]|uniref:CheY chemotaxis protein or a CheY-like REC (Receiver) domain n=1 Tax=Ohtaekwangia koreensis TaxID=688867 RepID=A0A1T5IX50_9BACT|nr:response regulator [Ohtaekwangia koreensis]SKC43538.1 CheY chemotaxis protein or a CheY-like REC (receiver) domain [Ohtaekwangia koreensis]